MIWPATSMSASCAPFDGGPPPALLRQTPFSHANLCAPHLPLHTKRPPRRAPPSDGNAPLPSFAVDTGLFRGQKGNQSTTTAYELKRGRTDAH